MCDAESAREALIRQTENVASATECTGLVPRLESPEGEAEERSLFNVQRAACPERMNERRSDH